MEIANRGMERVGRAIRQPPDCEVAVERCGRQPRYNGASGSNRSGSCRTVRVAESEAGAERMNANAERECESVPLAEIAAGRIATTPLKH